MLGLASAGARVLPAHSRGSKKIARGHRKESMRPLRRKAPPRLAADPAYDLLSTLRLWDRGCPPEFAARILAPIEEMPRS